MSFSYPEHWKRKKWYQPGLTTSASLSYCSYSLSLSGSHCARSDLDTGQRRAHRVIVLEQSRFWKQEQKTVWRSSGRSFFVMVYSRSCLPPVDISHVDYIFLKTSQTLRQSHLHWTGAWSVGSLRNGMSHYSNSFNDCLMSTFILKWSENKGSLRMYIFVKPLMSEDVIM